MEFLDCAPIGVCAVIRSNTVCKFKFNKTKGIVNIDQLDSGEFENSVFDLITAHTPISAHTHEIP